MPTICRIIGNLPFDPMWDPLKRALTEPLCRNWMYMAGYRLEGGVTVHTYKHALTRQYLNLSDDDSVWKYVGDAGYQKVSHEEAFAQIEQIKCDERS